MECAWCGFDGAPQACCTHLRIMWVVTTRPLGPPSLPPRPCARVMMRPQNEPHGGGWGRGGYSKDWRLGAQRLGNGVLQSCRRWLVFVEGVGYPGAQATGHALANCHPNSRTAQQLLSLAPPPTAMAPTTKCAGLGAAGDEGARGQYQWGEDLVGVRDHPVQLSNRSKLVYSPVRRTPLASRQRLALRPTLRPLPTVACPCFSEA